MSINLIIATGSEIFHKFVFIGDFGRGHDGLEISFSIRELGCIVNSRLSSVFPPQGVYLINLMFNLWGEPYRVGTMLIPYHGSCSEDNSNK